jgi:hypothetical protein
VRLDQHHCVSHRLSTLDTIRFIPLDEKGRTSELPVA